MTTTGAGVLIWASKNNDTVNSTTTAGSGYTLGLNDTTNSFYSEYSSSTVSAGTHAATFGLATPDTVTVVAVALSPNVILTGTFYVDNSIGSDTLYDGTSPTISGAHGPWASIAHVNAQVFNGGSSILFNATQTFSGAIAMGVSNFGGGPAPSSSAPVTFGSYGTGQATISAGTAIGFSALNQAGIVVKNLVITGSGGSADGVQFINSLSGNTILDYIQLINLTVSGFGNNGILINGNNGNSGYSNITISGCTTHDCTGNAAAATDTSGLAIYSGPGYLSGTACFQTVTITNHTSYNNTGTAGLSHWTGGGISCGETSGLTISGALSHNNGATNNYTGGGPVGIMVYDTPSQDAVVKFCESHHNSTAGTHDGDGFNVDGGTLEYCYSHDNYGFGVLCDTYASAANHNTVRYCILQNNNTGGVVNGAEIGISNYNASATLIVQIYNNTIYSAQPMLMIAGQLAGFSGQIANNVFYSAGGSFANTGASSTGSINNTNLIMNGNDYYTTGTFSLTWNGTTYTSFSTWKSAQSQEPNALANPVVNPLLVSPGSGGTTNGYNPSSLSAYQLQTSSPMLRVGLNLLSLYSINPGRQNYYGNSVPTGTGTTFNVGAGDQFGAILTNTFYVDNSIGSDTLYDGTASTVSGTHGPWASIAHVNLQTPNGGSTILFNAAQTFSGGIVMNAGTWGLSPAPSSSAPVTFSSYGSGNATISSGAVNGIAMTNIGGFVINNLTITGDGISGSSNRGINISNTLVPDTTINFIQVNNCTVSGYGQYGIIVHGTSGTGGYSNVTIENTTVHDCGGYTGVPFTAGLIVTAPVSTPSVVSGVYNFTNVLVSRCTVYNIPGTGSNAASSGAPFYVECCNNALIILCVAHDSSTNNGNSGAGVAGIQLDDSLNSSIQFCESYKISDGGFNADGDGFNVSSCINGTIEYCYSHDNVGCGYLLDNGFSPGELATVTMRYCISQNDGTNSSNTLYCGIGLVNEVGTGVSANVYNNTIYSSTGSSGIKIQTLVAAISGRVNNNIFYTTTGLSVNTSGNPPLIFDGNDYYRTGGFSLVWNGTTYNTFSTWKSTYSQESSSGGGAAAAGGLTSNPLLVNPGGGGTTNGYNPGALGAYRLQTASPMIGAGINLSTVFSINPGTQDYYGDLIPHGAGTGFPVGAAGAIAAHSLPLLGVGMIGWRATLPLAAAWKLGKAIAKNGIITRRRLLLPK